MKIGIVGLLLALSACTGASEIVSMGKDSYMVTGHNGSLSPGAGATEASKRANAYCAKQQRFMVVRRIDNGGVPGFSPMTTQLIFSCVTADDPEYARPNLKREPTSVIEDQRR